MGYPPLATLDTDIAMPEKLPVRQMDLRQWLLASGFREEFLGDDQPPATHYHLGEEGAGLYAVFLAPLTGSEYDRRGRRKATITLAGVAAQRLRHIKLLLETPWRVDMALEGFSGGVRIANPVSYLAQKLLIHEKRGREDRAKDILYIHDTLEVFGARLEQLQALWRNEISRQLAVAAAAMVPKVARDVFGNLNDDVRRAAQISAERRLTAESVREACEYGFSQLFE